jgi:DNA-binding beta-propeller fold protein YncE
MNKYAGKVRIGVIAIFCGLAFAIVGLHRSSGRAYSADPTPTLLVSDVCSYAVTAYSAASNGDVSPLSPVPTGLSAPQFVTIDASGNIYATNACTNTITIYAAGSKGDAGPIAIIGGPKTGLSDPAGIALDSNLNIYVANAGAPGVSVYKPLGSSAGLLNETPIATISGSNTGLSYPQGIAVDSTSGNIYVADEDATSVYVYPPLESSTGTLNEAPTATISGLDTGLSSPEGIALDSSLNIYVADESASSVYVYPPLASSTGLLNETPTATISGSDTGLISPYGIALDSTTGKIYVADALATSVFVYPALGQSVGLPNEVPLATISGTNTGLSYPQGIALDSSDDIYVADTSSVFVYSAGSKGNIAPSPATISTTMTTGLGWPQGIALDSSGKIYVADDGPGASGPGSVFVYPAGSKANSAPNATISGTNTGLSYPQGIALDSTGKIYVADEGAVSVFVYSAGSKGNVAPTATISGSNTELDTPEGIALDSSLNIYVADDGDGSCDGTESVYVYPVGSNGNAGPSATISGGSTGLCYPYGIALDSSGNIYVADGGAASVFVYPPLASLPSQPNYPNVTPIATISGNQTGLSGPYGIALDSNRNIYVADFSANSVFTYPALGSSTGLLNEAPTATISGPLTELGEPQFIAVQPAVAPTPTATATATATPTATPTPEPDKLKFKPKSLKFGKKTKVDKVSKAESVTIKNSSSKRSRIHISITGETTVAPFAVKSQCIKTLAPGKSCKVWVTFTPPNTTEQYGELTINDDEAGAPQQIPLSGTGK